MRLLQIHENGQFIFVDVVGDDRIPPYAILSHTWSQDDEDEVTFGDIIDNSGKKKFGYEKIQFCEEQARKDGLQYFWVDTCCINKQDEAEVSHSINSMFRWYCNAARCYVYLSDVSMTRKRTRDGDPRDTWESDFRRSRWFTRGWTLQELIAPLVVEFFSAECQLLGSKHQLKQQIQEITGITVKALEGHALSNFGGAERLSWAEFRQTKHEEDKAYSLLGIFNVHMLPMYGEGMENAFRRLHEEIGKRSSSIHNSEYLLVVACHKLTADDT